MKRRVCLLAGRFDVTLAVSNGLASWARINGPWRIEVLSAPRPDNIAWLDRAGYAGLVATSPTPDTARTLVAFATPVVSVMSSLQGLPTVNLDDRAIGAMAAEHLVSCGYRRFAYYGVSAGWSTARYAGFSEALRAVDGSCINNAHDGRWPSWDTAQDERQVRGFLQMLSKPTAVMACSDMFARVLADAASDLRIAVPDDVAIVGVDNSESLCESDEVTLSSVDVGMDRMGQEAGRVLSQLMDQGRLADPLVLTPPSAVVQRRSTDAAAFSDREVANAVRYIRETACEGITVDDVCRHISISRRQLERRFLKTVGRLPGAQIRNLRIARAKELLSETKLPFTQIALRCGYEHLSSFSSAFKEATSKTPTQWRNS